MRTIEVRGDARLHDSTLYGANPNLLCLSDSTPDSQTAATGASIRVEIVEVDLRLFESARIHVTRLAGTASSLRPREPVKLDDENAYAIEVEGAEAWIGWSASL